MSGAAFGPGLSFEGSNQMIFKERVRVVDTGVFVIQVLIFGESIEGCLFPDTCEISVTFSRAFLVVLDREVVYIHMCLLESP